MCQKHGIDAHNKTATSLITYKNAQISYMNGYLNHVFKNINKKIIESFRPYTLFINIIYIKSGKNDNA